MRTLQKVYKIARQNDSISLRSTSFLAVPCFVIFMVATVLQVPVTAAEDGKAIDISSRRELMVDKQVIAKMNGNAEFRLHHPTPRGVALETSKPWEGNMSGHITVFRDGDKYRMYYKGWHSNMDKGGENPHPMYTCYAESKDGIHWERPDLGIVEFEGSKKNNIIWKGKAKGVLIPFKDPNPNAKPEARYKALLKRNKKNPRRRLLYAAQSPDGIHWELMKDSPIITSGTSSKAFDSPNLAFWDPNTKEYRAYIRDWVKGKRRSIKIATSDDFRNWSKAEWLAFPGAPKKQLYTNQVMPYPRAPHIYVGFPTRYIERSWSDAIEQLPEREHRKLRSSVNERFGTALTDGLFMSSRDGRTFKRWSEAFLRPGPQKKGNWAYGDNFQSKGLIRTEAQRKGVPDKYSFIANEGYWRGDTTIFRRYTIRMDGFVSINAPLDGGSFVSKPLQFDGDQLRLNFATSAAGRVLVELQDAEGEPVDGFSFSDCDAVIGNELDRAVTWNGSADVSELADKTVRLKFKLHDADLYALRFAATD